MVLEYIFLLEKRRKPPKEQQKSVKKHARKNVHRNGVIQEKWNKLKNSYLSL